MDSAARNFGLLLGGSLVFIGYGVCGIIAYVLVPLSGERLAGVPAADLLPAAVLAGVAGASFALASVALSRHRIANRRLLGRIESSALPLPDGVRAAGELTGLADRIIVVDRPEPFSFVYGLLVPRVAISAGMLGRLSQAELGAALEHERYHVRNLDPLRELAGRMLSRALFFAPLISLLHRRYKVARELAADRMATQAWGSRPLAGALLVALESPHPDPPTGVGLGGSALLASRLSQLESGRPATPTGIDRSTLLRSLLGVGAVVALFLAAVHGVDGGAGLARMFVTESAPANLLLGAALCVAPLICLAGAGYGRLTWSARRAPGHH